MPDLNAKFLIDTGSTRSFISPKLACKYFPHNIKVEHFSVTTSHGTTCHKNVVVVPRLQVFPQEKNFKFHIYDFSPKYDGLIGFDILDNVDAQINCRQRILNLPTSKIPLMIESDVKPSSNSSGNIFPYKIKIQPRTEQVIKIPVKCSTENGILPYTKIGDTMELPQSLVKIDNNLAITTIINKSERPQILNILEPFVLEPFETPDIEQNFIEQNSEDNRTLIDKFMKENLKNLRLSHLNQEEYDAIRKLCFEFRDILYCDKLPLSFTNEIKHSIKLTDETPIYTKSYRFPEIHKNEIQDQIDKMLKQNIIQPSNSPWSSPVWVVPKKKDASGKTKWRVVIDYRRLNDKTVNDKYPIPNISEVLDKLGNSNYFTTLDLTSGFHQIEVNPADIPKTAFTVNNGHFEFKRMPFGLKNAPATFQRVMDNVLRGLHNEKCLVYLDDIIIFSSSLQEHIERLREVFSRLRRANLKIQLDKSEFLRNSVPYLGHIITKDGIRPNPEKIHAIKNFPIPKSTKDIKSFLGLLGYYRRFIKDFAKLTKPLTSCLKKGVKIEHNPDFVKSFENCKQVLCNDPVLQYPDFGKEFILTTDASNFALGAVLSQGNVPNDRPVAYASRTLNDTESRYSTIEKELLAIVWACKHFRPYLFGRKFKIYTDHRPLRWLFSLKEPNSKLVRWRLKLEEYDYEICYKKGSLNSNADALSRIKLNALETQSIINNPGDIDNDVAKFLDENLDQVLENSDVDENQVQQVISEEILNVPTSSKKINIISNIQIRPPIIDTLNTPHSECNPSLRNSIPILDEMINNKPYQMRITHNPHDKIMVQPSSDGSNKIFEIKIPTFNRNLILKVLKEFVLPGRKIYIYFHTQDLYNVFNEVYIKNFNPKITNLISCTKLVNTLFDKDEKILVIRNHHESKTNHRGIVETTNHIQRNYYWQKMRDDISHYINSCEICKRAKYSRIKVDTPLMITETASKPFQILHMDIFQLKGEKYLTLLDKFSKFGQALKIPREDSLEICKALTHFFSCFGVPQKIVMDNATAFKTQNCKDLLNIHNIKIHFTTPNHHDGNSPVERFHSSLLEHYRLLKQQHPNDTDIMPYILIAYNNSIHSATSFTPFELVYGHTDLRDPSLLTNRPMYQDYSTSHKQKLDALYKQITEKTIEGKIKQNLGNTHDFLENDIVYTLSHERARNKDANRYSGPFVIEKLLENNRVQLRDKESNKIRIYHVKELRPKTKTTTPLQVDIDNDDTNDITDNEDYRNQN